MKGERNNNLHAYAKADGKISTTAITKTAKQVTENGYYVYKMNWTITVNQNGVANGYDKPTLTDELPEGATLENVTIKDVTTGDDVTDEEAVQAGCTWEPGGTTFEFVLPNQSTTEGEYLYHEYEVTLRANIDPNKAGTLMNNEAEFKAYKEFTSSVQQGVFRFGVSATAGVK